MKERHAGKAREKPMLGSCSSMFLFVVTILNCSGFLFVIADVDFQKLSHALKILSETEKQLRMSKNQTTWLTVALLQLSSLECTPTEVNDSKFWLEHAQQRGRHLYNKKLLCE